MTITIVVAGGGHAGIHAVKAINKSLKRHRCRIILLDPQPYHVRKVLLFKGAAGNKDLTVPWSKVLPTGTEFIRGAIQSVNPSNKCLEYKDIDGMLHSLDYDAMVLAIGSVVPVINGGGLELSDLDNARKINRLIVDNIEKATVETSIHEKERLLSLAIVGGGISGIETVFELNEFMRTKAKSVGLDPEEVKVHLVNSEQILLPDGTDKLREKLHEKLKQKQIVVWSGTRALKQESGNLHLSDGKKISVGSSVWTVGLRPNPAVQTLGLPVASNGRLNTDSSYRVLHSSGIYSIGDCANIIDPISGKMDGMTCKEAISQAGRLGRIIAADLTGSVAPIHRPIAKTFCFSLGTNDAIISLKLFGYEVIIEKKTASAIRKLTWDLASLTK